MQYSTIPIDTKKATKEEWKFSEINNVLTHSLLTCPVFCPDRQPPLMPLWLNNNCSSTTPFQSPIQVNSTSIEKNVSIQENLIVAISLEKDYDVQHSNSKHMAWFTRCQIALVDKSKGL